MHTYTQIDSNEYSSTHSRRQSSLHLYELTHLTTYQTDWQWQWRCVCDRQFTAESTIYS